MAASLGTPLMRILYGTETGSAQDVAETLWKDARFRNIPARVSSFGDYTVQVLMHLLIRLFSLFSVFWGRFCGVRRNRPGEEK
ncbi:unnamed protein product [Gongylonema pulchrum]|uniref:Flavodoxin-like domain-containing protein n=1 Tax=Gongylonema pulchrum TaxID=637853 RepID=A0A183DYU9_9BILA|nr:unnamed protein product [Gongylonema pulchrum]